MDEIRREVGECNQKRNVSSRVLEIFFLPRKKTTTKTHTQKQKTVPTKWAKYDVVCRQPVGGYYARQHTTGRRKTTVGGGCNDRFRKAFSSFLTDPTGDGLYT